MNNNGKWSLIDKKTVFNSKWMSIEDRSYELPDGRKITGYLHLNRSDYVLIVTIDDKDRVIIEKQYRRGVDDFTYELPAGWIEKSEEPIDAATRELKEETGLEGRSGWVKEIYTQPGFSSMKAYVVLINIIGERKHSEEHEEDIEVERKSLGEIKQMIKDGKIKDMGSLAALGMFLNNLGTH